MPVRPGRSGEDTVEIFWVMQRRVRSLPATCRASQVVRFILAPAIILLNDLFSDDSFRVDGSRSEVGEDFWIDEWRAALAIVPVIRPNGGKVELGPIFQILVVDTLKEGEHNGC